LLLSLTMNYLAHAYLSFNQPGILVGNMISDFVKGKKQYDYSILIQKGIKLHRSIDAFTDDHPITKELKKIFKPAYGLYAGAFIDIVYDHFLANDKTCFASAHILERFSIDTYAILEQGITTTPLNFQQMFPYMKAYNWLYNYRYDWGIQKSFAGMVRRAKYMNDAETAFTLFQSNKTIIGSMYNEFFPLLKNHAAGTLQQLIKDD
jgi:acyl carrier protein phosphodiesterase